jgi:hypothetical protein
LPCAAGLAMLAVTATSATASAEWEPISQRTGAGADMYWWSGKLYGSSLPIVPFLNVELTNSVYLDVQFPFVMSIDGPDGSSPFSDDGTTRAALGNPTVGVHYADTSDKVSYYLGGRISAPLGANHDPDWQFADYTALIATAGYDSFLFAVDYLPISGMFGLEIQPIRPIWLRLSIDPIFLFKLSHDPGFGDDDRNAVVFAMQQKFEFAGRSEGLGIGGGLDLQAVFQVSKSGNAFGTLPDRDRAQVAVEPFFLYDKGALFLRLGVLIALDEPLGFGFDESSLFGGPKVATGHFQIGGRF